MHIDFNDLLYMLIGFATSYLTYKLNFTKASDSKTYKDRDYIVEQNDRLNRENEELRRDSSKDKRKIEELRRENDRLRNELERTTHNDN